MKPIFIHFYIEDEITRSCPVGRRTHPNSYSYCHYKRISRSVQKSWSGAKCLFVSQGDILRRGGVCGIFGSLSLPQSDKKIFSTKNLIL